jgi:multisubunit Na+/H+ antiporter MnhB subunit
MTQTAAVVAVVVALMLGYYWARWRRWEGSAKSTRALADVARSQVWKARGAILLVGVAVYVVLRLWINGRGR